MVTSGELVRINLNKNCISNLTMVGRGMEGHPNQ
jgi:hypothetical protein